MEPIIPAARYYRDMIPIDVGVDICIDFES